MTDTPGKQRNVVVFSLTDNGAAVAQRLVASMPHLQHLHKPDAFVQTVQAYFAKGTDCVFVCATGIVVRAIAPVLRDKHTDPAIVVLDEHGQFAIPLLSGHEGGAGELAYKVAGVLGAQCVVTSHNRLLAPRLYDWNGL